MRREEQGLLEHLLNTCECFCGGVKTSAFIFSSLLGWMGFFWGRVFAFNC